MKAVLDTNVLTSSLLRDDTPPADIRRALVAGAFTLVTAEALMAQLVDVLSRPHITKRIRRPAVVADLIAAIGGSALIVEPADLPGAVSRDPDDDLLLATAVAGAADVIVTGDNDLLVLEQYDGIRIITPRQFLDELRRD